MSKLGPGINLIFTISIQPDLGERVCIESRHRFVPVAAFRHLAYGPWDDRHSTKRCKLALSVCVDNCRLLFRSLPSLLRSPFQRLAFDGSWPSHRCRHRLAAFRSRW